MYHKLIPFFEANKYKTHFPTLLGNTNTEAIRLLEANLHKIYGERLLSTNTEAISILEVQQQKDNVWANSSIFEYNSHIRENLDARTLANLYVAIIVRSLEGLDFYERDYDYEC